ncbi:MAG TPA: HipA domain-containing protein [Vicinamibacterales bacterium]|nr:HipA domain-containing protein [Vicinamibacterales bacterium]
MYRIEYELDRGLLSASQLRERLGVSPATLMRLVRDGGPDVLRLGRARASKYALRQIWPHLDGSRFPLFRVTEAGTPVSAGELVTLAARQSVWMPAGRIADGLPMELVDARPSGFLGRHFATIHADLRLPPRLADWSDHHILLATSRRGEDLPGDLIVGEESFARWQALDSVPRTRHDYPALADATIAGHPPGSSAGGERPKFGVLVDGRHLLVKFAARDGAADGAARRWCDLLILEAIALDVVRLRGADAARTTIVETPSHWFLESERFDRVGGRGRVAVLSLAAIHDDLADSWARAAVSLRDAGRLTDDEARRLRWLDAFGALIGNTDRHQFNVLFFTEGARLRLAPSFDQVSMLYAPTADGQVLPRVFAMPAITSDTLDVWDEARDAARQFWAQGSDDARLSDDMRFVCASNAQALAT